MSYRPEDVGLLCDDCGRVFVWLIGPVRVVKRGVARCGCVKAAKEAS